MQPDANSLLPSPFSAIPWRHSSIQLMPVNPVFEPITLEPEAADADTIVGKFIETIA